MKRTRIRLAALVLGMTLSFGSAASETFTVTGEVLEISQRKIKIGNQHEVIELSRDLALPNGLRVGDEVIVRYQLDAKAISLQKYKRQQAGSVGSEPVPAPARLDDRAFFPS